MPRTKSRKKIKYVPVVELPPLSPDECEGLRSSILVNGVLVPVLVDCDGPVRRVIDGNHRKMIADDLGYECPEIVVPNLTDEELRAMARALNLARRQLTTAQKRAIIADQLAETPDRSNRWIGKMLGVSHPTVASVKAELAAGGKVFHLGKSIGQDGKHYPNYWSRTQHEYPENNQNYQTPRSAIKPLLKHLPKTWTIWECACGRGNISGYLHDQGRKIIATDIMTGHDFLTWKPRKHWDAIITNPPHRHMTEFLRRCFDFGKPFALLLPLLVLEGRERHRLFRDYGVELLMFDRRVEYEAEHDGSRRGDIPFASVWVCHGLLPKSLVFAELVE